jgi:pyridoxamine 5'-phosphate oxidase
MIPGRPPRPHLPRDLPSLLDAAWATLARGVAESAHGFHHPVLATRGLDGAPAARTVILRDARPTERLLLAHTDIRGPKLAELAADPRVAWTFYDAESRLQLRAIGVARIEHDTPLADERWGASTLSSRRIYLAPNSPGAPADTPSPNLPEDLRGRTPDRARSESGRLNFGVVVSTIHRIDLLELAAEGHCRAIFELPPDAPAIMRWVEP